MRSPETSLQAAAGFYDASHFAKVLRTRTDQTPLQMRRASRS
jgi:transcriptional regulator GlxA family with amidase domain